MDSDLFWLYLVNIALGVVTLVCVLAVAGALVRELAPRLKRRLAIVDTHAFHTPELGATMADGGQPVAKDQKQDPAK
jgi:hypothetical protein